MTASIAWSAMTRRSASPSRMSPFDQRDGRAGDRFKSIHHRRIAVRQIVKAHDMMARRHQWRRHMAANISRAARQ
jgi:hypothetical protein